MHRPPSPFPFPRLLCHLCHLPLPSKSLPPLSGFSRAIPLLPTPSSLSQPPQTRRFWNPLTKG
ncbi:putative signal peptide protein [Puccinia sorghi]|uniref:Putative signal peptide protein n=1 Tax=Puccinia sorghi TaxID=27349 RepID=A0A0L6VNZ2_9BASI|nr:putative signal peptide protein [Puccinia sorghi]